MSIYNHICNLVAVVFVVAFVFVFVVVVVYVNVFYMEKKKNTR